MKGGDARLGEGSAARALLLVPSERHLEASLAEAAVPFGARVRTLRTFVEASLGELDPGRRLAGPEVTALITRRVLDALPQRALRYPDEPAARASFAIAVDRAIAPFRRAGTRPSQLAALPFPEARLFAEVLEGADAILGEAGLLDARGARVALAARLRAVGGGARRGVAPARVVVTGLLSWEAGDLDWIEALHARAVDEGGGVRVALPRLGDGDHDPVAPVADALERRWASLPEAPEIEWTAAPARDPGEAAVIEARCVEAEARAVASRVLRALERGSPPERIAIVLPDLDEGRLEPLRGALATARVPFSEPRGRPANTNPEARAVLSLLAMAEGPVTRDHLIDLLRSPGAHTGHWMEKAYETDAATRATELSHRLRDVPVGVDADGRLFVEQLAELVASRQGEAWMPRALARVLESVVALRGAGTRRALARRLDDLFERLDLGRPSVGELSAALRDELAGRGGLLLDALGEGSTAVRALRDGLAAIVTGAVSLGCADAKVTPAELAIELEHAALALPTSRAASRAGAVRVGRAADVAGLTHDLVIVMGLDGGAYGGGDDGPLGDRVAAALPPGSRPSAAFEREAARGAELAWAMAGGDRVILTRSSPDDAAELGERHPVLLRAIAAGARPEAEPVSRLARAASSLGARSSRLVALAEGGPPDAPLAARVTIERSRAAFFLDPRAPSGPHTGRVELASDDARARLEACVGGAASDSAIAVTMIERAAGCAFAGFAGRVLRVRRAEDTGEAASARDRGTLVHRALHAAFEGAREVPPGDPPRALAAARAAADAALRSGAAMAPLRREAVAQAVGDAVAAVAWSLEDDEAYRFALAEQPFGARQAAPWGPLTLEPAPGDPAPGRAVFVEGRIDRVDRTTDGRSMRVVDYKTGRPPDLDEHGRTIFQLPLYAEVVARALGAAEVSALYLRLRSGGAVEPYPKRAEQRVTTADERAAAMRTARGVVVRQWLGDVAPRPVSVALCARCDARDVCRRPAVMPVDDEDGE
jgi:RecB family exonuclease